MALFRVVPVEFWKDPLVLEEMNLEEKIFYLYMFSNPNSTQIGIYKIVKGQIAFDTGMSLETINNLMDKFENEYNLIKYNNKTREIAIKNWGEFNLNRVGKPMLDCINKELEKVEDKSLLEVVIDSIKKEEIKILFKSHISSDELLETSEPTSPTALSTTSRTTKCNTSSITSSGQQEQKQEHKQKQEQEHKHIHTYLDTNSNNKQQNKSKSSSRYVGKSTISYGEYKKLYEANVDSVNEISAQWLNKISEEIDVKLFKKAIEIATNNGKCTKAYINGIINQWLDTNIRTKTDLDNFLLEKNKGGTTQDEHARTLCKEDEQLYTKPSEEQLKRARELLIS